MNKLDLMKIYHSRKANCCKCGCTLTATISLGYFFIMDNEGGFYCTECDKEFLEGDERIFEFDEEYEEE